MSSVLEIKRNKIADGVLTLTLNRPDQRNSLTWELISEIKAAISAVGDDSGVRVIVLRGNGPAYCAGHDMKEITEHRSDTDNGKQFYEKTIRHCSDMM